MKLCTKCHQVKHENDFYKKYGNPISQCKICRSEIDKKRYHEKYRDDPTYKERAKIRTAEWYKQHKELCNSRASNRHKWERLLVFEAYGGKCVCCGENRFEFLAIDHINGNGNKHRKKVGQKIQRWLIKKEFPEGYRILCHNCNQALGHYGYCPHKETVKEKQENLYENPNNSQQTYL